MTLIEKILAYDPTEVISRANPKKYNRTQSFLMRKLFPNDGNTCACGCGKELSGRRTRWATDACTKLPTLIYEVLAGRMATIYKIIAKRDGECCRACGKSAEELREMRRNWVPKPLNSLNNPLEVDHVVPVYKGGGGCWLDGYQLLCWLCHKKKTKEDVKRN